MNLVESILNEDLTRPIECGITTDSKLYMGVKLFRSGMDVIAIGTEAFRSGRLGYGRPVQDIKFADFAQESVLDMLEAASSGSGIHEVKPIKGSKIFKIHYASNTDVWVSIGSSRVTLPKKEILAWITKCINALS